MNYKILSLSELQVSYTRARFRSDVAIGGLRGDLTMATEALHGLLAVYMNEDRTAEDAEEALSEAFATHDYLTSVPQGKPADPWDKAPVIVEKTLMEVMNDSE